MKLNLKEYRGLKVEKHFQDYSFFFLYNSTKIKSEKWVLIEQDLKALKLEYNQIFNKTSIKTIDNSIYKNIKYVFSDVTIFMKPIYKSTKLDIKTLNKKLDNLFIILLIKLNNKIYITSQFKNLKEFSYQTSIFNFNRNLNRYLKSTYKLTQK